MDIALARRLASEAVGTGLLVAVVIGSGIAAEQLSPADRGLQLLQSSIATGAALVALILAFGAVSGAHFNPIVTAVDRLLGGMRTGEASAYIAAQIIGGAAGAVIANAMFDLPAINWSTNDRTSVAHSISEVVATFGLLVVILGVARAGPRNLAAFAVGGYIAAAYWFTSSTSFANPAVTIARTMSDTFAGIAPASVPWFIVAQCAGGALALGLAWFLYPDLPEEAGDLIVAPDAIDPSRRSRNDE